MHLFDQWLHSIKQTSDVRAWFRWSNAHLTAKLHPQLQELLELYLKHGQMLVARDGCQHVFVDMKGRFMEQSSTMSLYWAKMIKKMGFKARFPPHRSVCISPDPLSTSQLQTYCSSLSHFSILATKLPQLILYEMPSFSMSAGSDTFLWMRGEATLEQRVH